MRLKTMENYKDVTEVAYERWSREVLIIEYWLGKEVFWVGGRFLWEVIAHERF